MLSSCFQPIVEGVPHELAVHCRHLEFRMLAEFLNEVGILRYRLDKLLVSLADGVGKLVQTLDSFDQVNHKAVE